MAYPRFQSVMILALAIGGLLLPVAAIAAPVPERKPNMPTPGVCGGFDLMAEIRQSEPATYSAMQSVAAATKNDGAVLWRIERGERPVSYLFGTVHMSDPRVAVMNMTLRTAIETSKVVALEVADLSPLATARAIAEARDLVLFKDGRRLDKVVSPEAFEKVKEVLGEANLPARHAHLFKPWVVSMILTVPACERKQVARGSPVLDTAIAQLARSKKIPVVGLETIEEQLAAAAAVPIEDQIDILKAGLVYADRANDLMETVLQFYLQRRIGLTLPLQAHLAKKAGVNDKALGVFQRELVEKRNRRMRTKALALLGQGGAFIAVGAMHLVGETGLVALLRDAGYSVTPIE